MNRNNSSFIWHDVMNTPIKLTYGHWRQRERVIMYRHWDHEFEVELGGEGMSFRWVEPWMIVNESRGRTNSIGRERMTRILMEGRRDWGCGDNQTIRGSPLVSPSLIIGAAFTTCTASATRPSIVGCHFVFGRLYDRWFKKRFICQFWF